MCMCRLCRVSSRLESQRSLESSIFSQNIRDFNDALFYMHSLKM
jgi:hypothetical protein